MLAWLTLPFYDFCGFRSVAVNSVYKLQFFTFIRITKHQIWSRHLGCHCQYWYLESNTQARLALNLYFQQITIQFSTYLQIYEEKKLLSALLGRWNDTQGQRQTVHTITTINLSFDRECRSSWVSVHVTCGHGSVLLSSSAFAVCYVQYFQFCEWRHVFI